MDSIFPSKQQIEAKLNGAIAELLASDPANQAFIEKCNAVAIKIACSAPQIALLVRFEQGSIRLAEATAEDGCDLQLSGSALNLIKLLITPMDSAAGLRDSGIEICGDIGLLLELSELLEMLDIDWQLLLADKIGETPAVLVSQLFTGGLREAQKIYGDLAEKTHTKLRASIASGNTLPSKAELQTLKQRLRKLHYQLDRLAAQQTSNQ